ncbi:MAG: polynucleotide adenylyltransferase PcnB [Verrucomicrobia bacterium]|nr:polynucleotide adenylyltransferase PcnB [Verrucomicrobiota bacterium]
MTQQDHLDVVSVVRKRAEHNVSRKHMDPDALKVLYRLIRNGFTAYLVGGGVRDLLLGRKPKDFDVATSARPRQIRKLFRNSFLIGRRFRLIHVRFGQNVIETSTFRRRPDPEEPDTSIAESDDAETQEDSGNDGLYQDRDNTFGTAEEDAWRRDFTINALFYDIRTFAIIDYVGGLQDLEQNLIRCIGDPEIRMREDPVRMVRAVRFAARLGFKIEKNTFEAIQRHYEDLKMASPPRLLEEIYRLFPFASGEAAFRQLRRTYLMRVLFSELDAFIDRGGREVSLFWKHLAGLDARQEDGQPVDQGLLFATMLYGLFLETLRQGGNETNYNLHAEIANEILQPIAERYRMPKRVFYRAIQIMDGQRRFDAIGKRFSRNRFVGQESFPSILCLREIHLVASGGDLKSLDEWKALREDVGETTPERRPSRRGGRSRRRRGRGPGASGDRGAPRHTPAASQGSDGAA